VSDELDPDRLRDTLEEAPAVPALVAEPAIRPCPFCGSEDVRSEAEAPSVMCHGCLALGPTTKTWRSIAMDINSILEKHTAWLNGDSESGERADLKGANLKGANLRSADLRSADLRGANLWGADLWGADLKSADLRSADLRSANLRSANLWGADLKSADLKSADLWGADLWGADLWGADLRSADLRSADLRSADLWSADLKGADLKGADLRSANLWGADLRSADLRGANLKGANLKGANLKGANLKDCNGNMTHIKSLFCGQYPVTYTVDVMQIGCQRHKIAEWWEFDNKRILEMDGKTALKWWRTWKPILQQIIETAPAEATGDAA